MNQSVQVSGATTEHRSFERDDLLVTELATIGLEGRGLGDPIWRFAAHPELATSGPTAWRDTPEENRPVIFVVDADPVFRQALEVLIQDLGWRVHGFATAERFLAQRPSADPCCLILNQAPPDLCGLEVQRRIADLWPGMPIVFTSDCVDVRRTVHALKEGAVEFFQKPVDHPALLDAVRAALDMSLRMQQCLAERRGLQARYATLSEREREVMALLLSGLLNKQVAGKLGITEATVKAHRGHMMRKMEARSLVDLVYITAKLVSTPGAPK